MTHISCGVSRARIHRESLLWWTDTDTIKHYLCTSQYSFSLYHLSSSYTARQSEPIPDKPSLFLERREPEAEEASPAEVLPAPCSYTTPWQDRTNPWSPERSRLGWGLRASSDQLPASEIRTERKVCTLHCRATTLHRQAQDIPE